MAAPFLTDIDLNYNTLKRGRLDQQSADPSGLGTSHQGYALFRTDTKAGELWNGAAYDMVTGGVVAILGTTGSGTVQGVTANSAATAAGRADRTVTISTTAASGAAAGSMSAADYTKLANATATNTASTIVMRDASGNFTAGVITAALTGTASNATQLNSQAASYYLSRTNHTGTQLAATISDFDTQVRTSRLDQVAAPINPVAFNGQRATGLADPTSPQDAATKNYVDSTAQGLDVKASVRAATTTNIALTGLQTIDGISVLTGDRVLVKNQTDATTNGIYLAAAGTWTRTPDADTSAEVSPGMFTFVEEGTVNGDAGFVLSTNASITLGTTSLTFVQFSGAGSYTAGNGLSLTGSTFAVVGTTNRISVSGAGVDIASSYVGQTSITTLGTISSGTWQGTAIAVANGGTGANSAAGARTALGATTKVTGTITGNGALTAFTFAHNLASINHSLVMIDNGGNITYADFTLGANTDTITTAQPLANGAVYTLTAVG